VCLLLGKYHPFCITNKDWKKATGDKGKLAKHESSSAHKESDMKYRARQSTSSVAVHLSRAYAEEQQRLRDEKEKNRAALRSIIDIIRFLARQNISFRGHLESESNSFNRGNFLELVYFTAQYDPVLKWWIDSHPQNVSWLSHDIQNDLLHMIALEVLSRIAAECRGSIYSIICDEVSDRSNHELLSVVVRYVLDTGLVQESVIALIKVDRTDAEYLSKILIKRLIDLNMSLNDIVGQCYDGASNMAGQYTGVQARLKGQCAREPIFIHCWAHKLNLVLQDVVKGVPECSRIFDLLQKLYVVIEGSPKRHGEYLSCVSDLGLADGAQILQSLCSTRWSARSTNLRIVDRCMPAVIKYLQTQRDPDSLGLLTAIKNFNVIFGVVFLNELFLFAQSVSEALQFADTDLGIAASAVEDLVKTLNTFRNNDCEYERLYGVAMDRCGELGIQCNAGSSKKRKRTVPVALQSCVMDSFLTKASDALSPSDANQLKLQLKVDFF